MASESRKRQPKPLQWRLEWLLQTGVERIAASLPGPFVYRCGEALGGIAWRFMEGRRKIVMRNLRIAFYGEKSPEELEQMVRENFRRTGANLLSALHSTGLSSDQVHAITTMANPELADEVLAHSPGIVTMPPHMGNWEILTRVQRKFAPHHRIGAFYRPLNNPLLDARVLQQREALGSRLFSKRDSFHQAVAFLREGGVLGVLADQRVGTTGEPVRFFGRLTRASPLPSLMARRSKSGILAMGVIKDTPGRWIIRYDAVVGKISTASCMDAVERTMRASPLDVFWFQERWKVYFPPGQTIRDWLGSEDHGPGKPHRALLWLAEVDRFWTLPEEWQHPDVVYEAVLAAGQPLPSWMPEDMVVHRVENAGDKAVLGRRISEIDAAHGLPVDYILTVGSSGILAKAARKELIPVVSVDPVSGESSLARFKTGR